jgi:hypothetical protein
VSRIRRDLLLPGEQEELDAYDLNRLRFRTRIRSATGCHEWQGRTNTTKTPLIGVGKKHISARKMAWRIAGKPALCHGQQLRVTCGNSSCINPDHCAPHPRVGLRKVD